jgi:hypothetical protein
MDKPVILENNKSDTLNPKAAAVSDFGLSKPTDPSGYELWYNIEDQRLIDEGLYLFPLLD